MVALLFCCYTLYISLAHFMCNISVGVMGRGGRWQHKAAFSTGEDMEQFFSFLSRFNVTTKNMSAAGTVLATKITSLHIYFALACSIG